MKKITIDTLRRDLGNGDWPDFKRATFDSQKVTLQIKVPLKLGVFEGHFADQAVLPGILQVHWAAEIGRLIFSADNRSIARGNFQALRGIKFNGMVMPGQELSLSLSHNPAMHKLKFEFYDSQQKFSNGTLEFSGAAG